MRSGQPPARTGQLLIANANRASKIAPYIASCAMRAKGQVPVNASGVMKRTFRISPLAAALGARNDPSVRRLARVVSERLAQPVDR
jgi:hypothetical protein